MNVISPDDIPTVQAAMNDILKSNHGGGYTVGDIKRKHHLTGEEYDMIFELCMPFIRNGVQGDIYKDRFNRFKASVVAYIRSGDQTNVTVRKIRNMIADEDARFRREMAELNSMNELDAEDTDEKEV